MSKARSMYAGSTGSNYGVNKNSPGNGNGKWQGLWPSVGHARNARLINTRAGGDNRNVVFCMNQLGGVGRKSNMFATTADGVKQPCPGDGLTALAAVRILQAYLKKKYNGKGSLILVGEHETLKKDGVVDHSGVFTPIKHFYKESADYKDLPPTEQQAVDVLNNLKIKLPLKKDGPLYLHVAGYASFHAQSKLFEKKYGRPVIFGSAPGDTIFAYSIDPGLIWDCGFTVVDIIAGLAAPEIEWIDIMKLASDAAGCMHDLKEAGY